MNKIDKIKQRLEDMRSSDQLPYVARYWTVHEIQKPRADRTCYCSYYNGYVFTDLPTKPMSTPFDFDRND